MKTRQGFVSNSSSSSFIVGVGKIKSLDAFKKWASENKIKLDKEYGDISVKSTSDILKGSFEFRIADNKIYVEEPTNYGGSVSITFNSSGDDYYCIVHLGNDEGDCSFENEYGDLDYDISSDYFVGEQASILEMLSSGELLEDTNYSFGAGRNG